jgi:hypothetical protein
MEHAAHAASPSPTAGELFTPAEIEGFHQEDRMAATYIVGLMVGIFVLGLIGYLGVCYWVTA